MHRVVINKPQIEWHTVVGTTECSNTSRLETLFLQGTSALSNQNQVNPHLHNINFYFAWEEISIEEDLER